MGHFTPLRGIIAAQRRSVNGEVGPTPAAGGPVAWPRDACRASFPAAMPLGLSLTASADHQPVRSMRLGHRPDRKEPTGSVSLQIHVSGVWPESGPRG